MNQLTVTEVYPRQAIYGFQLAPDGKRLSFVLQRDLRVEEVVEKGRKKIKATPLADLYLLSSDGGYPRPLTDSGDCSNPAVWSPDGEWLAFEREGGLQIMPVAGGEVRTVYRGKLYHPPLWAGDAYLGYPRWSPDGNFILFATREEPYTALRLVSADGRLQRELLSLEGYIIGWDWSPDARQVVLVTRSENGWVGDVRLLEVEAGRVRVLWEEENYEYQKPVAVWSPDGESIIFRSNRSGWAKLWVYRLDDQEPKPLTSGEWDEYAFRLSPDGKWVVCASKAEQNGSGDDLWLIPLSGGEPKRLTYHPGVNTPLAWSNDDRIYYWHSSPIEPGDLWVVSAGGGEPKRLTWSSPIELERKLRTPEEVLIPNDDGTQIPALVYLPVYYQKGQRYPAIIWIRGGPTAVCRYEFNPFYNWLANQGYVVITPNYRGSIGYGIRYMVAVAGEGLGKNDLSDVLATSRYIRTLPYVDLTRGLGIGGHSWGGYLALMAVIHAPDDFSCAVAGAAITDWFIQQAQTEVRYYDRWLIGGWVYEQTERAKERSPVNFVECIRVPLLLYHGEEDRDVPFSQFWPFVEKARQAGVEVECVTYPAEGHENQKLENQQDLLTQIQAFFRRHLQPWNFRDNPCADQVQY
jgi:dipeptidyl aminopeptidase/acylaminoacyl peptidase